MSQITVKANVYECGKLNCLAQLHVTRRLGPMLVVAGISVEMLRSGMKIALDDLVQMAGPVMEMMSRMPEEDVDYIIFTCLNVVTRQSGTAFARVTTKERQIMFDDMDLIVLVRVVCEVLKENLGNFLTELGDEPTSPSS